MTTTRWRPRLVAGVLLSCVPAVGGCSENKRRYLSPDERREVVIEVGIASIDTVWTVSVQETTLVGDRRDLGCFTDDDPDSATPTGVTWTNADEILIETAADSTGVQVKLKPDGPVAQIKQTAVDFLVPCPYS